MEESLEERPQCSELAGEAASLRDAAAGAFPIWEEFGATPGVFVRVANKGVTGEGVCKSGKERT